MILLSFLKKKRKKTTLHHEHHVFSFTEEASQSLTDLGIKWITIKVCWNTNLCLVSCLQDPKLMWKPQSDEGFGSISTCFEGCASNHQVRWNQVSGSKVIEGIRPSHILVSHRLKCNRTTKLDFGWKNRCVIRFSCDGVTHNWPLWTPGT